MCSLSVITVLILFIVSVFTSKIVEGSQPIIQKTIEALFTERSRLIYPEACKLFNESTARQSKMCQRNPGLPGILALAKDQAVDACEEAFQFDRWNCSLVFNRKPRKRIFKKLYRETAFIYALMAASLTHAVAKGCASGNMTRCSCSGNYGKDSSWQWKRSGCGDDFKYGKRITKNFFDFKHAGTDRIAEVLKQDVLVGIDSIGIQMREVCKCHGFSGSCTTKTCWKRLGPFSSAMGTLKKQYHHAVKKKITNFTSKRAIIPKVRMKIVMERKNLVYLHRTPNLCASTAGRNCKDRDNCATLCCGRGFTTSKKSVTSRCRCKMVNCCIVTCDTCVKEIDYYTCK